MRTIGNVVEAVARSQHLELFLVLDVARYLLHRVGGVQAVRAILEITCPVRKLFLCRPAQERRDDGARRHSSNELDKCSLVQGYSPVGIDIIRVKSLYKASETAAIVHQLLRAKAFALIMARGVGG